RDMGFGWISRSCLQHSSRRCPDLSGCFPLELAIPRMPLAVCRSCPGVAGVVDQAGAVQKLQEW
ncbi:MAG: hypothetical protein ACQGQO_06995, partial [Sphaerochaetaceae bacterium]